VETYAAVRLFVDTWRWAGVPFYIRAQVSARHRHRGQDIPGEGAGLAESNIAAANLV
jgi:Glucose-6-phosphate dehydrogenase, C-terminal domain